MFAYIALGILAYALGFLNGTNRGYNTGKVAGHLQAKYSHLFPRQKQGCSGDMEPCRTPHGCESCTYNGEGC